MMAVMPAGWKLVWSDEFDKGHVDLSKWTYEVNGSGGGNHELQYYTDRPENSRIDHGNLIIEARKEDYTGHDGKRHYTSARMVTKGKGDWKYGAVEVRAKLPTGPGMWPAIWMMPTDEKYGGWPGSGEIDIMELVGRDATTVHGTLHYGKDWQHHKYTGEPYKLPSGDFSQDYHVFRMEWQEGEIRWYVDGKLYQTQTKWETGAPFPAPFDQRFFLILNVAVGGDWPGPPTDSTKFPEQMVVDYVRVYEKG